MAITHKFAQYVFQVTISMVNAQWIGATGVTISDIYKHIVLMFHVKGVMYFQVNVNVLP
jgi:hypothetical protein